jgi:hypothetical protein
MDNLLGQISSKLGSKSNLQVVTDLKQVGFIPEVVVVHSGSAHQLLTHQHLLSADSIVLPPISKVKTVPQS